MVFDNLQRFTERSPLNHAESFVTALYCVRYSPLPLLTLVFMMISVWTNPTANLILIGARMTEQSQVKHELLFCARVLLHGEYTENFLI